MRLRFAMFVALAALLVPVAGAVAHVEVLPTTATQGQSQEFTIRVPTEREVATTAVSVQFPDQITVYSFAEPPPGWTMRPVRAPDGTFSGVRYSGGQIGVSRYMNFTVLGTPFTAGTAVWRARQTYADGVVKPWTGPVEKPGEAEPESGPTDPGPAAGVVVSAPGETPATTTAAAAPNDDGSDAGVWLGVIAIVVSALAVVAVGLLWSTRPARLPSDD